jgi:SNF2 family DNA or RNA helicase
MQDLRTIAKDVELDPMGQTLVQQADLMKALWAEADVQYESRAEVTLPLPEGHAFHRFPLFAHQRLGLAKTFSAFRAMLLWEMGTGKTRVMIELVRWLKKIGGFKRALVVCPTIVLPTWEAQTETFAAGGISTLDLTRGDREKRLLKANQYDMVLTTYGVMRAEARAAFNHLLPDGYKVSGLVSDNALRRVLADMAKNDPGLHKATLAKLSATPTPLSDIYRLVDYDIIIFDEAHVLGSWESDVTRSAMQLSTKATRRYLLTGTAGDNPLKFYPLLQILHPWLEKRPYWQFKEHHVVKDLINPYLVTGWRNMDEINAKIDLVASRMKKDECLDLPPVLVNDVVITLGSKQKARYNEIVEEMRATQSGTKRHLPVFNVDESVPEREQTDALTLPPEVLDPDRANPTIMTIAHGAVRVNKLLQLTSGFLIIEPDPSICHGCEHLVKCVDEKVRPYTSRCQVVKRPPPRKILRDVENPKLDVFEDLVENIMDSDATNKVIAWGVYLPELDDMEEVCKKRGWGYVRVDGSNTHKIRSIEDSFQNDPKCRVYIGQVASGVGITLTAANYTIYYSLPWDRVTYRQSFDRNNRAGQTRKITVYRLIGRDTLDEFVSQTLNYKDHLAFTLSEKIRCASCDRQTVCGPKEVRPFREGCKYQADADRPIARAGVLE